MHQILTRQRKIISSLLVCVIETDYSADECQKATQLHLAEEERLELIREGRSPGNSLASLFLELGMTMEDLQ